MQVVTPVDPGVTASRLRGVHIESVLLPETTHGATFRFGGVVVLSTKPAACVTDKSIVLDARQGLAAQAGIYW
jgi:hypothetical protein